MGREASKDELYLRPNQLAARWGVHRTTLWRWVSAGDLPEPTPIRPKTRAWSLAVIEQLEANGRLPNKPSNSA
jgi:prophage regulatory protein